MINRRIWVLLTLCLSAIVINCRNEAESPKPVFKEISFEEHEKSLEVGQTVTVSVNAGPKEAKNHQKIQYKATEEGIVEIKEESGNDGVVFEGLKSGATVIVASANGIVDYLGVIVNTESGYVIPHIILSEYVIEMKPNEKRSIVATLAGGTPLDSNGFTYSNTNSEIVSLEYAGNIAVVDSKKNGESVVSISHPKAQFSVNVLVYVSDVDEVPVYITTTNNVINMDINDLNYQYEVTLMGASSDNFSFSHIISDGADIISLVSNNNIGTISPKKRGIARIVVTNAKAVNPLEIVVIVNETIEYEYINLDQTLVIMNEGEVKSVTADFIGAFHEDVYDKYEYEVSDNNIVAVTQSQNVFALRGLQRGSAVINITNAYADFKRSLLVIVNGAASIMDNEIYINTNQTVITTQVGDADTLLSMTLFGGNEADKNNFLWTVDDGTVINVTSMHGNVRYRAVTNIGSSFEALALIKPLKVGTANILLENPKSKNSFNVLVKVYPRNTFGSVPVVLDGQTVYKVSPGESIQAQLRVATGRVLDADDLAWSSSMPQIADVNGSALTGIIEGKEQGIASITVKGSKLKNDFNIMVIVGDESYINNVPYFYVSNPYATVLRDNSLQIRVICVNMTDEEIENIQVAASPANVVDVVSYRNNIAITGITLGRAELLITSGSLPSFVVAVAVEDYKVNPAIPYYLTSSREIYGIEKGKSIDISVNLVGATSAVAQNVVWKDENKDENIVAFSGNGTSIKITGKQEGQTVITAEHPNSQNKIKMVIYVVAAGSDPNDTVVIFLTEPYVLMTPGETRFVSIITNAHAQQKSLLHWTVNNANVVDVQVSQDNTKAFLIGKEIGNATISVRYGTQIVPQLLYISVSTGSNTDPYINVPSIIELTAGDYVKVEAAVRGITDLYNISWTSSDESVAVVYGNGDNARISAVRKGSASISVVYNGDRYKFTKNILVFVYNTVDEMVNSYVMAAEQTRYVMYIGDTIPVSLTFGIKGFPEHETGNIMWLSADTSVLAVNGNGKNALVTGKKTGIAQILVKSNIANDVYIEVEIMPRNPQNGLYRFEIAPDDRLIGVVNGSSTVVSFLVFNGQTEVYGLSGITYKSDDETAATVAGEGSSVRIEAHRSNAQTFITISHPLAETARILVYTADNEDALLSAYPVMAERDSIIISKGGEAVLSIYTKDNNPARLALLDYVLDKNSGSVSIAEKNKKELILRGDNLGSDILLIRYNHNVVQRVYVSVLESGASVDAGYLFTENIIGLVIGQEYETAVNTDAYGPIEWLTDWDSPVIELRSNGGRTATIAAQESGETEITVRAGLMERVLSVVVCENSLELEHYRKINIERRHYKMRVGDTQAINIYALNGEVQGTTEYLDINNYTPPFGGIMQVVASSDNRLNIQATNAGTAKLVVKNAYYNDEITLTFEVSPKEEWSVVNEDRSSYIIAPKALYILEETARDVPVYLSLGGAAYQGHETWWWEGFDPAVISLSFNRSAAIVSAVAVGETEVTIRNNFCDNTLKIKFIIGPRYVIDNPEIPYIYVERTVYEVNKGDPSFAVPYIVANVDDFDINKVRVFTNFAGITLEKSVVDTVVNVNVTDIGVKMFTISYGTEISRDIYVLVRDREYSSNVYLTTSENYVIAGIGELRTINVSLVGYEELNPSKFEWRIESDDGSLTLMGNGEQAQIFGTSPGQAVIAVNHPETPAGYPLRIYINIVQDPHIANRSYLTTSQNVVEMTTGSNEYVYVQRIGSFDSNIRYIWSVNDASTVSIQEEGTSVALITAKKEGLVQVTVYTADQPGYRLNILVVIKRPVNSGIFIRAQQTLFIMSPGDPQRRVTVELENGDTKDYGKFKWEDLRHYPYDITLPAKNVISFVSNNEESFVTPLNEGTATFTVKHEKAENNLTITVYVTRHKEISFSASRKVIVTGNTELVAINLPTYKHLSSSLQIRVEDSRPTAPSSDVTPVCQAFASNHAVLVKANKAGTAIVSATIDNNPSTKAELYITVVDEIDPSTPQIIVEKNIYHVNPKTADFRIGAMVTGANIFDADQDNIKWTIIRRVNDLGTGVSENHVITVVPNPAENAPPYVYTMYKARQLQVEAYEYGEVTVQVSHDMVDPQYWKTFQIIVEDANQLFSINPLEIVITDSRPVTVTAEVIDGTTNDYNSIKWVTVMQRKWDGTLLEVVRIMGSGREVTLYPMNDGEVEVIAFFENKIASMKVSVENEYFFDFAVSNIFMHPGEKKNLKFTVRPLSSAIRWVVSSTSPGQLGGGQSNDGPVITYAEKMGNLSDSTSAERYMEIEAHREGEGQIVGMANGRIANANVYVTYNYSLRLDRNINTRLVDTAYDNQGISRDYYNTSTAIPRHDMGWDPNSGARKQDDGKSYIDFTVYPPNCYIKVTLADGEAPFGEGFSYIIEQPNWDPSTQTGTGQGRIIFTSAIEMRKAITVSLYKPKTNPEDEDAPALNKQGSAISAPASVIYEFPGGVKMIPYVVRGNGVWSRGMNTGIGNDGYKMYSKDLEQLNEQNSNLAGSNLGGRTLDKLHMVGDNHYSFTLGDGETHYLILDKEYSTAAVKNIEIKRTDNNPDNYPNFEVVGQSYTHNGIETAAVRIQGKEDKILYNRVKFDQEPVVETESKLDTSNVNGTPERIYIDGKTYTTEEMVYEVTNTTPSNTYYYGMIRKTGDPANHLHYDEIPINLTVVKKGTYAQYKQLETTYPAIYDVVTQRRYKNLNENQHVSVQRYWLCLYPKTSASYYDFYVIDSDRPSTVTTAQWNAFKAAYCETVEIYPPYFVYRQAAFIGSSPYADMFGAENDNLATAMYYDYFAAQKPVGFRFTMTENLVRTNYYLYRKTRYADNDLCHGAPNTNHQYLGNCNYHGAETNDFGDYTYNWDKNFFTEVTVYNTRQYQYGTPANLAIDELKYTQQEKIAAEADEITLEDRILYKISGNTYVDAGTFSATNVDGIITDSITNNNNDSKYAYSTTAYFVRDDDVVLADDYVSHSTYVFTKNKSGVGAVQFNIDYHNDNGSKLYRGNNIKMETANDRSYDKVYEFYRYSGINISGLKVYGHYDNYQRLKHPDIVINGNDNALEVNSYNNRGATGEQSVKALPNKQIMNEGRKDKGRTNRGFDDMTKQNFAGGNIFIIKYVDGINDDAAIYKIGKDSSKWSIEYHFGQHFLMTDWKDLLNRSQYWDRNYYWGYTQQTVRNKLRWVNMDETIIMPYYVLNTFPFRYESRLDNSVKKTYVGLNDGNGIPMPSTNTIKMNLQNPKYTFTLTPQKNDNDNSRPYQTITLDIIYEERNSHHMYCGDDIDILDNKNSAKGMEYEGEIKNYKKLFEKYQNNSIDREQYKEIMPLIFNEKERNEMNNTYPYK